MSSHPSPRSLKRRKTHSQLSNSSSTTLPFPLAVPSSKSCNSSPSPPKRSKSIHPPSPLNSCPCRQKVIWVDLGINPSQTYWWPALIINRSPGGLSEPDSESDLLVNLMPDPKLPSHSPRSLKSFKATQPFEALPKFNPTQKNPILNEPKGSRSDYPSANNLRKAYQAACEKHVLYAFQDEEDLPEISDFMIPLSQESQAELAMVFSQDTPARPSTSASPTEQQDQSSIKDHIDSLEDDLVDEPDPELEIPGETVLSRMKRTGEYWPACVVGYAGLKALRKGNKSNPPREKHYRVEFCDQEEMVVPRSFFLTSDQEQFHQVEIGKVATVDVTFEELLSEIGPQLHHLDQTIQGQSKDSSVQSKHDHFLSNLRNRGEIPKDVKYGKYCEEVIQQVGGHLRELYLTRMESGEQADERFQRLSESEKSQYIFDILVPQLILLITIQQHTGDAEEQLSSSLEDGPSPSSEEIWKLACQLAQESIHKVDIVDKVIGLRVRKKNCDGDDQQNSGCKMRMTWNSQRKSREIR